jgi:hypothetical protein
MENYFLHSNTVQRKGKGSHNSPLVHIQCSWFRMEDRLQSSLSWQVL